MSMNLALVLVATLLAVSQLGESRNTITDVSRMFLESGGVENKGTKWAVLVAGSNGYWNYRHQVYLA